MVSETQAQEIRLHLMKQLEKNGFGIIARNTLITLEENSEEIYFDEKQEVAQSIKVYSERDFLIDFLNELIQSFKVISNNNYQKVLEDINSALSEDSLIFFKCFFDENSFDFKSFRKENEVDQVVIKSTNMVYSKHV